MMITDSANPTNAPPAALNVLITGSLATISRTFINILSKADNPIYSIINATAPTIISASYADMYAENESTLKYLQTKDQIKNDLNKFEDFRRGMKI